METVFVIQSSTQNQTFVSNVLQPMAPILKAMGTKSVNAPEALPTLQHFLRLLSALLATSQTLTLNELTT